MIDTDTTTAPSGVTHEATEPVTKKKYIPLGTRLKDARQGRRTNFEQQVDAALTEHRLAVGKALDEGVTPPAEPIMMMPVSGAMRRRIKAEMRRERWEQGVEA